MSMQRVETCILETEHPQLVTWSEETKAKGGIVVPYVGKGITELYRIFKCDEGLVLRQHLQKTDLIIYGAWIEKCIVEWTEFIELPPQLG